MTGPSISELIIGKFELRRRFVGRLERHLEAELETMDELRDEALAQGTSVDGFVVAMGPLFSEFMELEFIFPWILRTAALTSTFFLFEDSLTSLCRRLEANSESRVRIDDLKGRGLHRLRLYLIRVARVPFRDPDILWAAVDDIRRLRNCLVHEDGFVSTKNQGVERFVSEQDLLYLDETGRVFLEAGFHEWASRRLEAYVCHVARFVESQDGSVS